MSIWNLCQEQGAGYPPGIARGQCERDGDGKVPRGLVEEVEYLSLAESF